MSKCICIVLVLSCLLLTGCPIGFSALPAATTKNVTPSDLAGLWQYEIYPRHDRGVPTNDGVVTIELREDGTFEQTVRRKGDSKPLTHTGKWALTAPPVRLRLKVLKPPFTAEWTVEEAHWWVVDSTQKGGDFAVFGGAHDSDPDQCNEFRRLRQPVAEADGSQSIGQRWTSERSRTRTVRPATPAEEQEIFEAYDQIYVGMSVAEAEAILGKPNHGLNCRHTPYLPTPRLRLWDSPYASGGVVIVYKGGKVAEKTLNPNFRRPRPAAPTGNPPAGHLEP